MIGRFLTNGVKFNECDRLTGLTENGCYTLLLVNSLLRAIFCGVVCTAGVDRHPAVFLHHYEIVCYVTVLLTLTGVQFRELLLCPSY